MENRSVPTLETPEGAEKLKKALEDAEAVIIGAGAGLSTSAGFIYAGERFERYFSDFACAYHFHDMYSGGFYPYATQEEFWAFWSRNIYVNRYMDPPKPVYERLFQLVKDKDYFVLTTNVDHCFQKAGFDKQRLFYTQGDYGLFQCSEPCHMETYGNEEQVRSMVRAQGFVIDEEGGLTVPEGTTPTMSIPSELLPRCPKCGKPMTMNLRCDERFVEDRGWHAASGRYSVFLRNHREKKTLFLEVGTGWNTPGIIKYPFWQMTYDWPDATYACLNYGEAYAPEEIQEKAICINADADEILEKIV
ncbi:MAG: Sir2 silent information regulator family NAD-dependent deacetylase [Clostridia bacterium]|nr:Sir2 silent information regulator family NAD-dependent deacetylase [Clostridia bacterium]MBR1683967.1 Sir2 silent information regulator family NAD-dependent deacetylase [Clostridia bacterium]MBR2287215.1 Sir2 silent information regulator family NAD-dependent deacetylase [Clostridia bacterium]